MDVREADADKPVVTLSDDVVTLRPWSRDDAGFMVEACADPAIRRYNGVLDRLGHPAPPLSITGAEAVIDEFALSWRAFATTETPLAVHSQSWTRGRATWSAAVVSTTGPKRTWRSSVTGSQPAREDTVTRLGR